jgi:hypothetical protein
MGNYQRGPCNETGLKAFLSDCSSDVLPALNKELRAADEDSKAALRGAWKIEETEIITGSDKKTYVPKLII